VSVPGWTVDPSADAAYLSLSAAPVHRTLDFGRVNVDVGADGLAVGVELLTLSATPADRGEHHPACAYRAEADLSPDDCTCQGNPGAALSGPVPSSTADPTPESTPRRFGDYGRHGGPR
jgi:uncharacterized protein YuzE